MSRCSHRPLSTIFMVTLLGSMVNAQADQANAKRSPGHAVASVNSTPVESMKPAGLSQAVVKDLEPFTHTAVIPVGSDVSSIRFQGIKPVRIATRVRLTANGHYCNEAALSEAGDSIDCRAAKVESYSPAYRATYSYEGPPLASDEYGSRYFTFSVYFRLEEIAPADREVLLRRGTGRMDAAELFEFNTSKDLQPQVVIDEEHSAFCEGTYVEGLWVRTKPQCEDRTSFKTIQAPSGYLTLRVDPVQSRRVSAACRPRDLEEFSQDQRLKTLN